MPDARPRNVQERLLELERWRARTESVIAGHGAQLEKWVPVVERKWLEDQIGRGVDSALHRQVTRRHKTIALALGVPVAVGGIITSAVACFELYRTLAG